MEVVAPKLFMPPIGLLAGSGFFAGAISGQAGGDNPGFAKMMVEDGEAVIKANVTVG